MDLVPKQPRLSEVMGGLVSSVAYGRGVADVEALRIATQYHKSELLKGLPVPRLRLRRVSIDLPLVITKAIPGEVAKLNAPEAIAAAAASELGRAFKAVHEEIGSELEKRNLSDSERKELYLHKELLSFLQDGKFRDDLPWRKWYEGSLSKGLQEAFLHLRLSEGGTALSEASLPREMEVRGGESALALREESRQSEAGATSSDASIRSAASTAAEEELRHLIREASYQFLMQRHGEEFDAERGSSSADDFMGHAFFHKLLTRIRDVVEFNAIGTPTVPADFYVAVDTDSIKSTGGGPSAVTRLSLELFEEGLEWVSEKRDGEETSTLHPE